jgi:tRNA(fMet)-specific endonuclease VapC
MKYLLDTDHLSLLQRQTGDPYSTLSARMERLPLSDFAVSTVTFHEQLLGAHAYINRARKLDDIVKGYDMISRLVFDFKVLPLVSFDENAAIALATIARLSSGICRVIICGRYWAMNLGRRLCCFIPIARF